MIDWDALVLAPNFAVFGESMQLTYTPKAGAAFPIDAVFDSAFRELTLIETDPAMNTVGPVIGVRLAQFAAQTPPVTPAQGDRVLIPRIAATFVVRNVEPDSHGWALLRLNATA